MPEEVFTQLSQIGKINGKSVIKPAAQVNQKIRNHRTLVRQVEGNTPSNLVAADGQIVNIKIPEQGGGMIKGLALEVTVNVSAAGVARMLPSPLWIDQIIFHKGNGDQEAQKMYGEQLYWLSCLCNDKDTVDDWREVMNMDGNYESREEWAASSTHTVYIPLPGAYPIGIPMFGLRSDILMECTFRNAVESGSGVVTVAGNGVRLLIEEEEMTQLEEAQLRKLMSTAIYEKNYITYDRYLDNSTFTASTLNQNRLNNIRGKVPFLMFALNNTYNSTDGNYYRYQQIGTKEAEGRFELLDSTNITISGTNLRDIYSRHFDDAKHWKNPDFLKHKAVYTIVHGSDPNMAIKYGVDSGYFPYSNEEQLDITPASAVAAVNEIQTLTTAQTADGGAYYLSFAGYQTEELAFGANAATIKAALEALPPLRDSNPRSTVTVSGPATATFTVTFDGGALAGRPIATQTEAERREQKAALGEIRVIPANPLFLDGAAAVAFATTQSTAGVEAGFATGSKRLQVFGAKYKKVRIDRGFSTVSDL